MNVVVHSKIDTLKMFIKVLLVLAIFATAQCGFLFDDGPFPTQQFRPLPPAQMPFHGPFPIRQQSRPPPPAQTPFLPPNFSYPPQLPSPDVRGILSNVPILSNLFRGAPKERANSVSQQENNVSQFNTIPQSGVFIEASTPQTVKNVVDHIEVDDTDFLYSDKYNAIDVTDNSINDEGATPTTEDYETTTDYDLFGRMGPPPAVVASLLG